MLKWFSNNLSKNTLGRVRNSHTKVAGVLKGTKLSFCRCGLNSFSAFKVPVPCSFEVLSNSLEVPANTSLWRHTTWRKALSCSKSQHLYDHVACKSAIFSFSPSPVQRCPLNRRCRRSRFQKTEVPGCVREDGSWRKR